MLGKKLAQCEVDRCRVAEDFRQVGLEQHEIRSLTVASIVLAANVLAEVVFSSHLVARLSFVIRLLHEFDAHARWQLAR